MAKGIIRKVQRARKNISQEMSAEYRATDSKFAHGLAGEGYRGGWRDALDDVLLALNGATPQNYWWEDPPR